MSASGKRDTQDAGMTILGRWFGSLRILIVIAVVSSVVYYFYFTPAGRGERRVLKGNGNLIIESQPSGMNLIVDEKPSGVTPQTVVNIQAGDHDIIIKTPPGDGSGGYLHKYDYGEWRKRVRVKDKELLKVEAVLEHKKATFVLRSSPSGAQVRLDGNNLVPLTPIVFDSMETGTHEVHLVLTGYVEKGIFIVVRVPATELQVDFTEPGVQFEGRWIAPKEKERILEARSAQTLSAKLATLNAKVKASFPGSADNWNSVGDYNRQQFLQNLAELEKLDAGVANSYRQRIVQMLKDKIQKELGELDTYGASTYRGYLQELDTQASTSLTTQFSNAQNEKDRRSRAEEEQRRRDRIDELVSGIRHQMEELKVVPSKLAESYHWTKLDDEEQRREIINSRFSVLIRMTDYSVWKELYGFNPNLTCKLLHEVLNLMRRYDQENDNPEERVREWLYEWCGER
ncbi:MAG TPA: PEGA domain-containing protein [Candidatus Paceibacterota bacterium]